MTGFAAATSGDLAITLKSVNHRGLDLHFHMPPQLDACEAPLRALLKQSIARGSVQVRLTVSATSPVTLNQALLHSWFQTFRKAAVELGIPGAQPDLNAALRIPGMFQAAENPDCSYGEKDILALTTEALVEFNAFREREGAMLTTELRERAAAIQSAVREIEQIRVTATQAFHQHLTARLTQLLGSAIEPHRMAHEAAILADRSDISEELVRLRTHSAQLEKLLDSAGEIGKKLDFLLQEMNRETNTILSKTSGLGDTGLTVTDLALACKSEIDKIREQSLNLE